MNPKPCTCGGLTDRPSRAGSQLSAKAKNMIARRRRGRTAGRSGSGTQDGDEAEHQPIEMT